MSENVNLKEYNETKIKRIEAMEDFLDEVYDFPKYTTQLINLANGNSQGTRPKVVGQLSELIKEVPKNSYGAWKEFYLEENNGYEKIQKATDITYGGVQKLQEAINLIDRNMVEAWINDLVIFKTGQGLFIQEAILKHISESENKSYRLATPEEESKGIDGYIGNTPVQIKNKTYTSKQMLSEKIDVEIIYYGTTDKYITIYRK